ncbi:hypothetical protein GCM10009594_19520 [Kocuria palustris]
MRAEGYAAESILSVLRQQGLSIAARTYRSWKQPARIAERTITDALVEDKIPDLAWTLNPATGQAPMSPRASTDAGSGSRCSAAGRPRRHLPRGGGPGDADPRPRGHPAGEEDPHHDPWPGRETCR